ncbi:MAG: dihydrolipoyl dehydrogenase [Chloroflexi bacterium]|nr:dihydrolipoyl dehydrogenase [Chloroflexota bacterium]
MEKYNVAIIGAGPGGYVAAIRAAQLGLTVVVIERDALGGVCTNWGCIPSKALLRNAEVLALFKRAREFGFTCDNLQADYAAAHARSRRVVDRLVKGVDYLLKKNKIKLVSGTARLASPRRIEVAPGSQALEADSVIVATGARPRSIPGLALDGVNVITYREALDLTQAPPSAVIVGAGAIGAEFAYLWQTYGGKVTLVEMLPHVLPNEDEEISVELEKSFARHGITCVTGARVEGVTWADGVARVAVATKDGKKEVQGQKVLVAVGVQPNTEGLGLEALGVRMEKGFIKVDARMQTNVPGVYAIGDVTGELLLAHVASAQGVVTAEAIAGRETRHLSYQDMPRATYCQPQVASIGLTEAQARQKGLDIRVGRFPFRANGKALAMGDYEGQAKLVVDARTGEVLGAHLIGPEVTELLGELSLAKLLESTPAELGWAVHPHPTLSEALREAALDVDKQAINI